MIHYGTNAAGTPVDQSTGQPINPTGLVPYSDAAVKRTAEVKEKKRAQAAEEQFLGSVDPMEAYRSGYRMNEDGTAYRDPQGKPQKLEPASKVLKRGTTVALQRAGELYDNTGEISDLLRDPEVDAILGQADETFLGQMKDMTQSALTKFLQGRGVGQAAIDKVVDVNTRMQRLASQERKAFAGTAVSASELKSLTPWLPDAGDSYKVKLDKVRVAKEEGEQEFRRYLDLYKNQADMSGYYDAFGIDRFAPQGVQPITPQSTTPQAQIGGEVNWEDL